ncbi:MAG TPA: MASE1 domain-containing protein [Burkholderiales bacterium]|nr:MASE1 domain-containing protein [Burkholderiales bacterium]
MSACLATVRSLPYPIQLALVALIYLVAAKASLVFAIAPGYATAVWPPSGIAVASCLLLGERIWPAVWLGATLANLPVANSLFAAPAIACGNTLEAVTCAWFVRQLIGIGPQFGRGEDVLKFVAIAMAGCVIAATVAVHVLIADGAIGWQQFAANWWTWWQGDVTGIIIVTPLLLSWALHKDAFPPPGRAGEFLILAFSTAVTVAAVFGDWFETGKAQTLTFIVLPFIIWGAFRFTQREVTTVAAIISVITIEYTLGGRGAFVAGTVNESLLLLLAFVSTVVVTGLVLTATLAQRAR